MRKIIAISATSLLMAACKTNTHPETLPKPLSENPVENVGLDTENNIEKKELDELRNEILSIANSEKCTNPASWKTAALGAKACGGPQSYLAYSPDVDEAELLKKIKTYNNKSAAYNKKYNLMSDCMMVMPPETITCENGRPTINR